MEIYDYREAVKNDVLDYIRENVDFADYETLEALEEELNDKLFVEDSVTGNASGSYYCNAWKAEEALCHNWDLLAEALDEFGSDTDILRQGAEALDVTIRCYLLGEAIREALEEVEDEFEEAKAEEEIDFSDYDNFTDFCTGRDCNKCPFFQQTMIDKNFDCEEHFEEMKNND